MATDRYTLPFADVEVEPFQSRSATFMAAPEGYRWVVTCDDERIVFPAPSNLLTPVKPPLPPEPAATGSVVRVDSLRPGVPAPDGMRFPALFWRRTQHGNHDWHAINNAYDWDWLDICKLGVPVLLVPDRFAPAENLSDLDIACCIEWFEEHGEPLYAATVRRLARQRDALLAADSFGEPVELPVTIASAVNTRAAATVRVSDDMVLIQANNSHLVGVLLKPSDAREFARAVLAAATQAEKASET